MSRPWKLQEYNTQELAASEIQSISSLQVEEVRLASFDKGYKAGWEDASTAHANDQDHISTELGRSLQELSFTYHEARSAILSEMRPLLGGLVESVFPSSTVPILIAHIVKRMETLATDGSQPRIEVIVSPKNIERVEVALENHIAPPLLTRGEPSLGDGQAYLRFGSSEERIDVSSALAELSDAIENFFDTKHEMQETQNYG